MSWLKQITRTILFVSQVISVFPHGSIEIPITRDITEREEGFQWPRWMPIFDPTDSAMVCRNLPASDEVSQYVNIKAGEMIDVRYDMQAEHVGPCFFYIGDEKKNEWYKIWETERCDEFNYQPIQIKIPEQVPACDQCVLRWEWHALHKRVRGGGSLEFFVNCIDVKIESDSTCAPCDTISIPGHLPSDPNEYWYPYGNDPFKYTGPPITSWGCNGECSSNNNPPPDNPPERCSDVWRQCGGRRWEGPTCCVEGTYCKRTNQWYSQCLPDERKDDSPDNPPDDNPPDNEPPQYNLLKGVNLNGADFGSVGAILNPFPGVHGTHYIHSPQNSKYFASKGMNVIRYGFRWERIQNNPLRRRYNQKEIMRLDNAVRTITKRHGMYMILDPHNYARFQGQLIGSSGVPLKSFTRFWTFLARRYKNNQRVIFGLMNEPYDMNVRDWLNIANESIKAIRSTGAKQLILVPGVRWTGAWSWLEGGSESNGAVMKEIVDPLNNYIFELHQYFDSDYSGKNNQCVHGAKVLQKATDWARNNNQKLFLGEFAVARNEQCYNTLIQVMDYLQKNQDIWIGWTCWSASEWWGEYMFTLEPTRSGEDRPQMDILEYYI